MADPLCWKCGASLLKVPQPYGRHAECPACHALLHVCRQCRHFDPGKAKSCREPMAEPVQEKTRVNFCEWFQTGSNVTQSSRSNEAPRASLGALFGDGPKESGAGDPRKALDDLFGS